MLSDYMLGNTMNLFKSKEGVVKVSFGNRYPTDTIRHLDFSPVNTVALKGSKFEEGTYAGWQFELKEDDVVYGLGESVRGMNKRGFEYESFCSDDPSHTPDKKALYGAHNFFVVQGKETYGVYVDTSRYVKFDVGFNDPNKLKIILEEAVFDLYFFVGDFKWIIHTFRKAIGLSYVPPKWAFGYQQSRWSYEDQAQVEAIVDQMNHHDLPCDAVYLDIDYMEDFKDFTISDVRFPQFEKFVKKMQAEQIKLVPIIDAGVKVQEGYDVYEEGLEKGYFVVDENGRPFEAAVWPGKVHFPDFLNEDARKWFGAKYHLLLEMGIRGFWNDMNEPAIFYSQEGINEAFEYARKQEGKNLDIYTFFALKDKFLGLANAKKDYQSMFHRVGGELVNHYDVHNLYGYKMTQAAYEGFEDFDSNLRVLMITRASHIGMAKYSGIWTGDNASWWEHLKLNVQMMPALNMAGFLYSGADTGGFGSHVSPELLTRWFQLSVFTPLFRNHSALGTRPQEPWAFDKDTQGRLRQALRLRYALLPYLYSEFMKANLNHDLLFAPLSYQYPNERSKACEDQLLLGQEVMLAPIYEQNAKGRFVYLPEDMLYVPMTQFETTVEGQGARVLPAGDHRISVSYDEIPLFIKRNKLIPFVTPQNRSEKLSLSEIKCLAYVPDFARYELYDDDGQTKGYLKEEKDKTVIEVRRIEGHYHLSVVTTMAHLETIEVVVFDDKGVRHELRQTLGQDKSLYI